MSTDTSDLTQRLARLEKRNSRLSWAVTILLFAVLGSWVFLVSSGIFGPRFRDGAVRLAQSGPRGPELSLHDRAGMPRVTLAAAAAGGPVLSFQDATGQSDVLISGRKDGTTALQLKFGKAGVRLMAGSVGPYPGVAITDHGGAERIFMGIDSLGVPRIVLFHPDGSVAWEAK